MPDIDGQSPPNNRKVFVALCQARAQLWRLGEISLHDAIDWLQAYARSRGLISEFGQDEVQAIMSQAFREVRDD